MNTADQKIAEVLAKFGEPMAGNVWRVQGNAVIYHKALERIAQQAKISFDQPTIVRAERDECVILVTGRLGDRAEWSIGEALLGTNYRVSGKQAAYVYAMAEKRAKDRVILKLIELHGLIYSEEEADEFKEDAREQRRQERESGQPRGGTVTSGREAFGLPEREKATVEKQQGTSIEDDLKQKITKSKSVNAVTDLMLHADTQKTLNELPEGIRDEIRDFARARLVELGWPTRSGLGKSPARREEPAAPQTHADASDARSPSTTEPLPDERGSHLSGDPVDDMEDAGEKVDDFPGEEALRQAQAKQASHTETRSTAGTPPPYSEKDSKAARATMLKDIERIGKKVKKDWTAARGELADWAKKHGAEKGFLLATDKEAVEKAFQKVNHDIRDAAMAERDKS